MAKQQDQQKRRRAGILRDQWDRPYFSVIDKMTGDPIGALSPKFKAPLGPPDGPEYITMQADQPGRFAIRYDRWAAFLRERKAAYQALIARYARQMYGDKAAEAILQPPPELRRLAGSTPFPYELVEAAGQGNGYILGTRPFDPTKTADVKLRAILEEYQQDRIDTVEELPTGEWGDDGAVPEPLAVPKTRRERDEHAGTLIFS